jgi:hypothetical protein
VPCLSHADGGLGEARCKSCKDFALSLSHSPTSKSTPNQIRSSLHSRTQPYHPVGEAPGAKLFNLCPMSSRDRGALVRKEKAEKASEIAPSASPATLKPRRHATRAQAIANRAQSRRPLRGHDRVDAHRVPSCAAHVPLSPSHTQARHRTYTPNLPTTWPIVDHRTYARDRTPKATDPFPLSLPIKARTAHSFSL